MNLTTQVTLIKEENDQIGHIMSKHVQNICTTYSWDDLWL